jgi:hypothetical protein
MAKAAPSFKKNVMGSKVGEMSSPKKMFTGRPGGSSKKMPEGKGGGGKACK